MVFATVGLLALGLAVFGLALVRVYDAQLIRQTESELIAQGAVVAEAFHAGLQQRVEPGYGVVRTAAWPFPAPADGEILPILPSLRTSSPISPPAADAPAAEHPAEPLAQAAGEALSPLLVRAARSTLAGIRVVDTSGVVVASSNTGLGTTLLDREEIQKALHGEPNAVLRRRLHDPSDVPLASLSRDTGLRVSVALPVLDGERVWGAVLVTRTPMTLAKAFYADRWNLSASALVLIAVVALMSAAAAAFVVRPVRALVLQTRKIARGEPSGFQTIGRPVVQELAELSESLASMAAALRDRNDYIRSFAANVSHEFKTPLASIQGAIELLKESASVMSADQRERFLANIDQDARRLTQLVSRLLELARADARDATGPGSDAAAIARAVASRAAIEGVPVELEGWPAQLAVALPGDVLDAVLSQLVSNARQHGGEAVRVGIRLEGVGPVRIAVRDSGQGVSEANRARVFDPFFTTARDKGGTGLGLTISQAMLRAFGGRLELQASPGPGATFTVTLPANPHLT